MTFSLPELPFDKKALEPYMSENTLNFHYGKHHQIYVDNLNKLIENTPFAQMSLEEIIKNTAGKTEYAGIFNNAAQVWNHSFFWQCLNAKGGKPQGEMLSRIEKDFGSYEKFHEEFKNAALTQFGSGWAWLVEKDGKLAVMKTANADTPIAHNLKAFLTVDVWEHAYYLDYQNKRADFVETFLTKLAYYQK